VTGVELGLAERRYRWALLAYPPCWRRQHAEALLGTCLDTAAARLDHAPTIAELLGLVRHGLVWRLRLLWPSSRTREEAAVLALVLGIAVCVTCFVTAEWQPGVPAQGWRVEPGHVGPFATLAPVVFAGWFVAFAAALGGRPVAARRMLAGSAGVGLALSGASLVWLGAARLTGQLVAHPAGAFFGLRRPPAVLMLLLIPLALLALTGRPLCRARDRILIAVATAALTGVFLLVVEPERPGRTWSADQAYAFYRGSGFRELVHFQNFYLMPVLVLGAILLRRRRPEWLPAVLLVSIAAAHFFALPAAFAGVVERLVDMTGSTFALAELPGSPMVAAVVAAAIWWRWHRGRPGPATPR
jgi:hypothetical protein